MKQLRIAIVILSLFSLFLGCSKKPENKEVTLDLFFYKQEIKEPLQEMVDLFSKSYPNITIELEMVPNDSQTVLKTKMTTGDAPDIIQLQSYANVFEFAESGWLEDISNESVLKNVSEGMLNSVTYNDKQYALPMDVAGIGIIYNIDIFNENNINPPKTLTELKQACTKLKEKKIIPFAGLFKANWSLGHYITLIHTTMAGKKVLPWLESMNKGEGSYLDPVEKNELFKLLDFLKENSSNDVAEWDWNEQQAAFAKEECAMMVQGLWSYGAAIGTNPELNCGFIPFPVNDNPDDLKMYADADSTFALSSTSRPDKKRAAKQFLNWLSTPEAVKMWVEKCKLVPTFKGSDVSSMDKPFQDLLKYVSDGKTNPWAFSMYPVTVFEDACKNGAQEYMFGTKNSNQVIEYIDAVWKREIEK